MGLIYLDACLIIYLVEQHSPWGPAVAEALARTGEGRFGISPLVKCECLVAPIKRGDPLLRQAYVEFFDQLAALSMPEAIFLQAAELRAHFGLKTPDALHLACAQHHRCDEFWTNDDRLARASYGLARNVLNT